MNIDYTYRQSRKLNDLIVRLEVSKKLIDSFPSLPHVEKIKRQTSLLKSALFSAKIEGNTLSLEDIDYSADSREKKEIVNLVNTLEWMYAEKNPKRITSNTIKQLHRRVMYKLTPDAGVFRRDVSAIFNTAGVAVYMPPPPSEIKTLVEKFAENIAESSDHPAVNASISHFAFEKIHPFIDGNGRVGRLLSTYILKNNGFDMRGLVSVEEYINTHRSAYYDLLASEKRDITDFVHFFLGAIVHSAEIVATSPISQTKELPEDTLLPRRREIYEIVKDHRMVSFNSIKRKFSKIPDSTLHNDLKMLMKEGLIKKLGTTRGALYALKK